MTYTLFLYVCVYTGTKNFKICFVFIAASFKMPDPKHNTTQWDGSKYQHYSTHYSSIQNYFTWLADSKQKAKDQSKSGFFYTGKVLHY